MAFLFRPWVQPDDTVHQDDTVSTTSASIDTVSTTSASIDTVSTTSEGVDKPEDIPRQVRYKCVKEHVKERSEKKHRRMRNKTIHVSGRADTTEVTEPSSQVPTCALMPPLLPPPPMLPTIMDPYSSVIFDFFNDASKDCWEELSLSSPELVEAALAQGFPPSVLEEYVRVMAEQQRLTAERSRKQRPKKFRCPHCHVGFSNNGQLKGHVRIHTGERPFKCEAEHCGKSFTRNEELTRHRRIHSGLRPFPCPDCGKRFGRKDHLKKHIRTHYQQRYQLLPILPSHYPYLLGL